MVTLCGPAGVGKTCLARAAASHLYERRWFVEGCVSIELRGTHACFKPARPSP